MSTMNRVFLMGNLTKDPTVRQTKTGQSVADMRLAVSERFKGKSGEVVERVCFADIVAWERQAETCGQYLKKGAPVLVEGRLELDEWTTEQGEKRSRLRVRADRIQFLPRIKAAGGDGAEVLGGATAAQPITEEALPF